MSTAPSADPDTLPHKHRFYEDVLALLMGTLLAALGVAFYTEATLAVGGVAGVSMLVGYASGIDFATAFFVINLPFYVLAILRMGWPYTLRTFAAVLLVSVFSRLTPGWIDVASIDPAYAAIVGGGLIGMGLLILFRHRAGLGGLNILALYLQDKGIVSAGWFQLGVDLTILIAAFFLLPLDKVLLSILGAVVLNLVLAVNHRPGRYLGMS